MAIPAFEPRKLSDAAVTDTLGDDLAFLIAYNKQGEAIPFVPAGKEMLKMDFPLAYPPNEILGINQITTIRATNKCTVVWNGTIYCIPCP